MSLQVVVLNRFNNWPQDHDPVYPCVTLKWNTWDDYGFQTTFEVTLIANENERIDLGSVKIGREDMKASDPPMRVELKGAFSRLGGNYFSLGQDIDYYLRLQLLDLDLRTQFALAMRDIPILSLDVRALERHDVFRVSLMRFSSAIEAVEKGAQLFAHAPDGKINRFQFEAMLEGAIEPHVIPFDFAEDAGVPHRINILVGANGAGKTQVLARLATLLTRFEDKATIKDRKAAGETFEVLGNLTPRPSVYGVIAVSFSAFDDFDIPTAADTNNFQYTYCGLRLPDGRIADRDTLKKRISSSIRAMDEKQKQSLLFVIKSILPELPPAEPNSRKLYDKLSAGQRIVLNIVCDLILRIRDRFLVLLDEPETHLHPQLLATLLSVVNSLLETFDSFAIVATHSPIAVQQVVAKRVHIIRRITGGIPAISRPPIETFGANLSDISREVFEAAESDRDYRDALDQLLENNSGDVEAVRRLFSDGLGLSAEIYLASRGRNRAPTEKET